MEFNAGSINADSGMSKLIYESMYNHLKSGFPGEPTPELLTAWKKLAYSIAAGIIDYFKTESKIAGIDGNLSGYNKPVTFTFTDGTNRTI